MKSILTFCITLLLAASTLAVTSKDVTYKSGDETVHGILYTPRAKARFPASSSSTNGGG